MPQPCNALPLISVCYAVAIRPKPAFGCCSQNQSIVPYQLSLIIVGDVDDVVITVVMITQNCNETLIMILSHHGLDCLFSTLQEENLLVAFQL